jgi:hypothetical protein
MITRQKALAILVAASMALSSLAGCHTMGKGTGKAAKGVEEGAEAFEEGYEEGKEKKKKK